MHIPLVDLKKQYAALRGEILPAVERVFGDANFILGSQVAEFEAAFSRLCGCGYGVGVASGTDALMLALRGLGIGPGDQVITAANTFVATPLAVSYAGARPVLADIDPDTYTMRPDEVRRAITRKTRAIIPVHLYGHPADMAGIRKIAHERGIAVIEDACQAHGASIAGKPVGSFGAAGCFSFYPGKNLGAFGDAGMVVTNSAALAAKVRMLRNYGSRKKYYHDLKGFNSRLDTVQAAILSVKIRKLEGWNQARVQSAALYTRLLEGVPVETPAAKGDVRHVYHLYVIRTKKRDRLLSHLNRHGISAGIHYPVPVHLLKAYRELGYGRGDFPVTERYARQVISLPMYPEITPGQIEYVVDTIKGFFS